MQKTRVGLTTLLDVKKLALLVVVACRPHWHFPLFFERVRAEPVDVVKLEGCRLGLELPPFFSLLPSPLWVLFTHNRLCVTLVKASLFSPLPFGVGVGGD